MIGKDTITTHINQDIGHFCAFDNVNIFLHSSKVALFVLVYHGLRVALFNMMSCEVLCFNKAPACEFQDRPQQNQGWFFFFFKSSQLPNMWWLQIDIGCHSSHPAHLVFMNGLSYFAQSFSSSQARCLVSFRDPTLLISSVLRL